MVKLTAEARSQLKELFQQRGSLALLQTVETEMFRKRTLQGTEIKRSSIEISLKSNREVDKAAQYK